MPSLDCLTCQGSGDVQQDDDTTIICSRCDGADVLFVDEDSADTWIGAGG
jgi:hypothetical protein